MTVIISQQVKGSHRVRRRILNSFQIVSHVNKIVFDKLFAILMAIGSCRSAYFRIKIIEAICWNFTIIFVVEIRDRTGPFFSPSYSTVNSYRRTNTHCIHNKAFYFCLD